MISFAANFTNYHESWWLQQNIRIFVLLFKWEKICVISQNLSKNKKFDKVYRKKIRTKRL